jgi:hypothetical protein
LEICSLLFFPNLRCYHIVIAGENNEITPSHQVSNIDPGVGSTGSNRDGTPYLAIDGPDAITISPCPVMTYKTFNGTHKGTFMGIETTNKNVSFSSIDIIRIKDEQAIEHWSIRDNNTLWQQLTPNR